MLSSLALRQPIQRYGGGSFTIGETVYTHSVLALSGGGVMPLTANRMEDITEAMLAPVYAVHGEVEILLIGCGERFVLPSAALKELTRVHGVAMECMDTGAACRTYNFLLTEGRKVAAALIVV